MVTRNAATAEAIITKYAKTKRTKALANYVIRDIPEWHYWNSISKKELNMLRFVLRRLDKAFSEKGGLTRLLAMYQNRTGCLKGHLDWVPLNILLLLLISQFYRFDYKRLYSQYGILGNDQKRSNQKIE